MSNKKYRKDGPHLFEAPVAGCIRCTRSDYAGSDVSEFEQAGWGMVHKVPAGDTQHWQTHLGVCPDCRTKDVQP